MVEPMLARLVRSLPDGDFFYEPKWDGFRCLAFREGEHIDLRSRNQRPFARYFPEVVDALSRVEATQYVLDGELLAVNDSGEFDFSTLMARLHPAASRVDMLARQTPARFVVFDVLAIEGKDLTHQPFERRRRALEGLLTASGDGAVVATPITEHRATAERWLAGTPRPGVDGLVAKERSLIYQPGKRAMLKVKPERTADCVVAGLRAFVVESPAVASLLLGLYDGGGTLRHVGVTSSFSADQRVALFRELAPLHVGLEDHPWRHGFALEGGPTGRLRGAAGRWTPEMTMDWLPLAPERVCEVGYDQLDNLRFRHPARFKRWRPDRDARSCTLEQLSDPVAA